MTLDPAPLFTDVAPGPESGRAHWAETSDGKRIRLGHWPLENARGTVLLFPGRTGRHQQRQEVLCGGVRTLCMGRFLQRRNQVLVVACRDLCANPIRELPSIARGVLVPPANLVKVVGKATRPDNKHTLMLEWLQGLAQLPGRSRVKIGGH
mgnify:FL=1